VLGAKILRSLTAEERKLLTAKEEGAYGELAAETGVPSGTLRVRALRLCARLKNEFRSEYEPDPGQEDESCEGRTAMVGGTD
jgi:DNA-directed RNA polymerase specialized sigma24 family protein